MLRNVNYLVGNIYNLNKHEYKIDFAYVLDFESSENFIGFLFFQ